MRVGVGGWDGGPCAILHCLCALSALPALNHTPALPPPLVCVQVDAAAEWRACAALFTTGEAALLREAKPPAALVVLVQALTAGAPPTATAAAATQQQEGVEVQATQATHQQAVAGMVPSTACIRKLQLPFQAASAWLSQPRRCCTVPGLFH